MIIPSARAILGATTARTKIATFSRCLTEESSFARSVTLESVRAGEDSENPRKSIVRQRLSGRPVIIARPRATMVAARASSERACETTRVVHARVDSHLPTPSVSFDAKCFRSEGINVSFAGIGVLLGRATVVPACAGGKTR
jgi:hypothetical protein